MPANGYDLAAVRAELPILNDWTYLGTGSQGIMARSVLDTHIANIAAFEEGGMAAHRVAIEGYERARIAVAALIGADPDEVTLNRNASDGINLITAGVQLRSGDEVVISDEEGLEFVIPALAIAQRAGARVRFVRVSPDPDVLSERLRAVVNERTRWVGLSQVSCESGARLPVEIIREVVGPDVLVVVDAAQSIGQFSVDVAALNADVVIGNGHKWLCGPKGTGFAWFSPRSLDLVEPLLLGPEAIDPIWSRAHYQQEPAPVFGYQTTAERFEFGTRAWHLYGGLATAIDYQSALGWGAIFEQMRLMSDLAKRRLGDIPGVEIVTPLDWEDSSGFVTFRVAGQNGRTVSNRLRDEERITQRSVEVPSSVRVSCAYFTSEEDINHLTNAVGRIASGG